MRARTREWASAAGLAVDAALDTETTAGCPPPPLPAAIAPVLHPWALRDTLLRVAETELYDPLWSERILDEVARNLVADRRAT